MKGRIYNTLIIVLSVYVFYSIIILFVFGFDLISLAALLRVNSIISVIAPLLITTTAIFLIRQFSGRPFKSQELEQNLYKVQLVVAIWTFARFGLGLFQLITDNSWLLLVAQLIDHQDIDIYTLIRIELYYIASEIIPDYVSLEDSFLSTYKIDLDYDHLPMIEDNNQESGVFYKEGDTVKSDPRDDKMSKNSTDIKTIDKAKNILKFSQIEIKDEIKKEKGKLGTIHHALYQGNSIALREITFERLTRYDLESFNKDLVDAMCICK